MQLGAFWRLARRDPTVRAVYPEVVARFSRVAIGSVVVLTLAAKRRSASDPFAVVDGARTDTAVARSNFTHNVAGLVVLGIGLLALAGAWRNSAWSRHRPLGLARLALAVFLRSSGSGGAWPFGDAPFWLGDAEGLQHRLGAFLALAVGIVEGACACRQRPGGCCRTCFPSSPPRAACCC